MNVDYKIEGLDEAYKMLDGAPEAMLKAVKKASRAGGNAVAKVLRGAVPSRWKDLTQVKLGKTSDGNIFTRIGLVNRNEVAGEQHGKDPVYDWYKCYWANYGTLEGRDPSHEFKFPVKHSKTAAANRRTSRSGQQHQNFFEKASQNWDRTFSEKFEETMDREAEEYYRRKGVMQ